MLKRYTLAVMAKLWIREETKFEFWLRVELAIILAKVVLGQVPKRAYRLIKKHAKINVQRIDELEAEFDQDMIAFIVAVKESLKDTEAEPYANEFHKGNTSYDIEDPAMVLMLREAISEILKALGELSSALKDKALEHKWCLMIARTHGQFAQPSTFGHLLLVFARAIDRGIRRLQRAVDEELSEGRISGAVGVYAEVGPMIEFIALKKLGLRPADAETQILQRDRHAMVISVLAIVSCSIEQMCRTFWELMRSEVRELEEPRRSSQRGSSAMNWKRNPILNERFTGMPRLMRGHAHAAMENVATPEWREISQSSVERHIFGDATSQLHYMVTKSTTMVQRLVVFPQQMEETLMVRTLGVWAGQRVQIGLMNAGLNYDQSYDYLQTCSFSAVAERRHLSELLKERPISATDSRTAQDILGGEQELANCFQARLYIQRGIEHIFERVFGVQ